MEENNANVLNNENLNENMNANLNENENMSTETGADTGMDEGAVSGTEDSGMADADMADDGMAVGDDSGQEDAMEAARQELLERFDKIKGFKVIDDNGNEEGISVDDMVTLVALKMSSAMAGGGLNSGISTLEEGGVSALADSASTGNDAYENQLPVVTDCSHVRVINSTSGSSLMTKQAFASLLGGLLPIASETRSGLMSSTYWKMFFNCISFSDTSAIIPQNIGKIKGVLIINPIGQDANFFVFFVKNSSIEFLIGTENNYIDYFSLSKVNSDIIYTPKTPSAGYVRMLTMKAI